MPARTCTSPVAGEAGCSTTYTGSSRQSNDPTTHEDDPRPGRERFYRQNALNPGRWLRVVVDFNDEPGWVVTVLIQDDDPR